jgi:hypothetical protein
MLKKQGPTGYESLQWLSNLCQWVRDHFLLYEHHVQIGNKHYVVTVNMMRSEHSAVRLVFLHYVYEGPQKYFWLKMIKNRMIPTYQNPWFREIINKGMPTIDTTMLIGTKWYFWQDCNYKASSYTEHTYIFTLLSHIMKSWAHSKWLQVAMRGLPFSTQPWQGVAPYRSWALVLPWTSNSSSAFWV